MVLIKDLQARALSLRRDVLQMTTAAGSGHPTSCLSCADILAALWFNEMKFDSTNPENIDNDTFILSKGHAAPIYYACLKHAGCITGDLGTLRKSGSNLEGHPLPRATQWIPAATGSLGQGLAIGAGVALANKAYNRSARTFVLLGDSECAEGSVAEAAAFASHHHLTNLCAIIDMNRLGQRGPTMIGHNAEVYEQRFESLGWRTIAINGHDIKSILSAFKKAQTGNKPTMIIAKTIKGKGVSFLENKEGWHGKVLSRAECTKALAELPSVAVPAFSPTHPTPSKKTLPPILKGNHFNNYGIGEQVATRDAYGRALALLAANNPHVYALDAEVSNSTYTDKVYERTPHQFVECFIAEQTMIGVAQGLAYKKCIPCASTFAAFLTRAHDQLRMAALSQAPLIVNGSHVGVSIGEDGPSQMGLEDIALFRSLPGAAVLYPSDAIATEKLLNHAIQYEGLVYLRTTRPKTPVIYNKTEEFLIGDFKILVQSPHDSCILVGAGITLHEALKAHHELKKQGIATAVIDAYCIKPFPVEKFNAFVLKHGARVVLAEDHYPEGGLGECVAHALVGTPVRMTHLAVRGIPQAGSTEQLLETHKINAHAFIEAAKKLVK